MQKMIAFLAVTIGKLERYVWASLAGLEPSTGVPKISRSKAAIFDGSASESSYMGAFAVSANACAKRLVLPVLEK